VLGILASGCVLPFGTAAPQPSTTAGKGRFTLGGRAEIPTIDLLESEQDDEFDVTPFPVVSFEVGYGIHERLDLEVSLDTAVYIIAPLPLGGSGGFRAQVFRSSQMATSFAARVGYVGVSSGDSDPNDGQGRTVSAVYGSGSLSTSFNPDGWLSPGISLNYYGASVKDDPENDVATRSFANIGTATLFLDVTRGVGHFGPFANLIVMDANLGRTVVFTGGLFLYARFGDSGPVAQPQPPQGPLGPPGAL